MAQLQNTEHNFACGAILLLWLGWDASKRQGVNAWHSAPHRETGSTDFTKVVSLSYSMNDLRTYRYRKLAGGDLRLLKISKVGSEISCSLVHHDLTTAREFQALSYVWGTESASKSIECDGKPLNVTPHLLNGLLVLERQFRTSWFWIDAICVNQHDDAEKAVQVPRMTDIYSSATRVIVWLGPAYEDSDLAMSSIPDFNKLFANVEEIGTVTRSTLLDHGFPEIGDLVWLGILKLAFRPWFSRLWVVQEAVLAQVMIIICGGVQLDFQEIVKLFDYVRFSLIADDIIQEHRFQIPEMDSALVAFPFIERFRQLRSIGESVHIYSLLHLSRRKMASENVDKVYGIMGLMSDELRARVAVDYSPATRRNFWQLYIDISRLSLEEEGFSIISTAPSDAKHPDLPSWCPDFRHDSTVNSMFAEFSAGMADPKEDETRIPKSLTNVPGSMNMEFRGLEIDTIKQLVELCEKPLEYVQYRPQKAAEVLECERRCLNLSKAAFGTYDKIPTAHFEVLVAGARNDRSLYDVVQAEEDYHCMRALCRAVVANQDASTSLFQDSKARISAERYMLAMTVAWRGSSFFSTEGGRVGIGPKSMKEGDLICIFFGANTPHILRSDPVRDLYLFVGSAYVSGLMSGDEFYARDPINTYKSFVVG